MQTRSDRNFSEDSRFFLKPKLEPLLYLAWMKVEVGDLDKTALMLSLRTREDRVEGGELASSSAPAISENRSAPRAS